MSINVDALCDSSRSKLIGMEYGKDGNGWWWAASKHDGKFYIVEWDQKMPWELRRRCPIVTLIDY